MSKIIINYAGDLEKELFNPISRDNSTEAFIVLREKLKSLGYEIQQYGKQPLRNYRKIVYWDSYSFQTPFPGFRNINQWLKFAFDNLKQVVKGTPRKDWKNMAVAQNETNKLVLILWEGRSVCPANFKKSTHENFSRILTWDDSLVDNETYFKYCLPNPVGLPEIMEVDFSKKKLLVNISFNKTSDYPFELYSERLKTIRYFDKRTPADFDLYGYGWEKFERSETFITYRGPVESKAEVLPKYKFAVCYENNSDQPGYITEKIFDCLRFDCVPIYWGAPNILEYVDSDCFIDRRQFESHEELETYIKAVTAVEYERFRRAKRSYLASDKFRQFLSPAFADTFIKVLGLLN
jgi:hypothetical protein